MPPMIFLKAGKKGTERKHNREKENYLHESNHREKKVTQKEYLKTIIDTYNVNIYIYVNFCAKKLQYYYYFCMIL